MDASSAAQKRIPTNYLALNDIEHRRTQVRKPQTNGFIERFNRTALDEFFRIAFRTTFYQSVEALQADFDRWLVEYNTQRPHQGYRNLGKRPIETVLQYLESVRQEGQEYKARARHLAVHSRIPGTSAGCCSGSAVVACQSASAA